MGNEAWSECGVDDMEAMNKERREMALQHFNEPMLSSFSVVRCIGYAEDEKDCYIIVRYPRIENSVVWLTCVGGYMFLDRLKGQQEIRNAGEDRNETWDDFWRLDHWLGLNGAPQEPMFLEDYTTRESETR
jgi:hypothetical protein